MNMYMMKVECSKTDRISTLPKDIIENILTLMPLGEAVKTSILSKRWRYKWANIPKLHIDYIIFQNYIKYYSSPILLNTLLSNAIFHVLLLHMSPLLEFNLIINLNMCFEIDPIILYLSRKNTLQRLTLANQSERRYKLPASFFSFNKLEFLDLKKFVFKPPLTFNSFSTLRYLSFYDNVEITTMSLKRLLTNCPLLEKLYLYGKKKNGDKNKGGIAEEEKLTFDELFTSSPSLAYLAIEKYYMKHFDTLHMPPRLPISLVHLKSLYLGVSFMEQHELLCCYCLIKSSPNLTNFTLKNEEPNDYQSIAMDSLDLQERSNFQLDHLNKLEMKNFRNFAIEIYFLMLIVTQAPVLQKIRIEINENLPVDEELKISKDVIPNVPPSVKFMVERPLPLKYICPYSISTIPNLVPQGKDFWRGYFDTTM